MFLLNVHLLDTQIEMNWSESEVTVSIFSFCAWSLRSTIYNSRNTIINLLDRMLTYLKLQ